MGGNLAITIRKEDGTEHRMDRWTNPIPHFITNIDFINKRPEHFRAYIEVWNDMKADWDENEAEFRHLIEEADQKEDSHLRSQAYDVFQFRMTPCYASHDLLAPSGYGQVVVDLKNDVVLSAQDYSSLGQIFRPSACMEIGGGRDQVFWERGDDGSAAIPCILRELFEDGRITEIFIHGPDDIGPCTQIEEIKNSQALLDYLKKSDPNLQSNPFRTMSGPEGLRRIWPDGVAYFRIDMSPFDIVEFDQTCEGFLDMKRAILDLGFVLTDEECEVWDEVTKQQEEDK